MRAKRGFTLAELMVVIGVIALLAVIALPNLLEAQVRSKVSRTKADLKSVSVAVELYRTDNNVYPDADPVGGYKAGAEYVHACLRELSTPVAYMSTAVLPDVFTSKYPLAYVNIRAQVEQVPTIIDLFAPELTPMQRFELSRHEYVLAGVGPDRVFHNELVGDRAVIIGVATRTNLSSEYDPTNGTLSGGDITRTALGVWW